MNQCFLSLKDLLKKYPHMSVFAFAVLFLALGLAEFSEKIFDEAHYVGASEQWINGMITSNFEHPPLAKILIGLGIKIFGSNPIGWRSIPVLFGSLCLVGLFNLIFSRTKSWLTSFYFVLFVASNFVWFVQSRVAMLDIFGLCLLVWGWVLVDWALKHISPKKVVLLGLAVGLTFAMKWSYGLFLVIYLFCKLIFSTRINRKYYISSVYILAIGYLVYVFTFLPYLFVNSSEKIKLADLFFKTQMHMLDLQKSVQGSHPYQSVAIQWVLPVRPVWYAYKDLGGGSAQGILFMANPVIFWAFLISIFYFFYGWLTVLKKRKSASNDELNFNRSHLISFVYIVLSFVFWLVIPRKISFYYYFLPNIIWIQFFIFLTLKDFPRVLKALAILQVVMFLLYYPILAGYPFATKYFSFWMLLDSWI